MPKSPRRPTFEVEHNIPIPQAMPRDLKLIVYPWRGMLPGDSFLIPAEDAPIHNSIFVACNLYRKRYNDPNFRILVREVSNGTRVWRTS